jgi:hypothetical protein
MFDNSEVDILENVISSARDNSLKDFPGLRDGARIDCQEPSTK